MKLNNKGWGLVVFLLFLLMFFAFLLLVAFLINRWNDHFNFDYINSDYDSNNIEVMTIF